MDASKPAERKRAAKARRTAMTDPRVLPTCEACAYGYPPITQQHHIQLVSETQGRDTETVWLCPNCHAMVHEIRKLYIARPRYLSNAETRLTYYDYWVDQNPKLADKLFDIAKRSAITGR